MAKLAALLGKFGHPSGQVRQRNYPGLLLYSQTSIVGIAKGQENVTALTLHMDYPSWFFGIQINQNEPENVVLNCPSFHFAFWADLFFELLFGLSKPLMPNKMPNPYQTDESVLNQRAIG